MRLLLLVVFSLFSSIAFAGQSAGVFTIEKVHVESGSVYIFPEGEIPNALGCGIAGRLKIARSDDDFDQLYALALAAVASGKTVAFWVDICEGSPWGNTVARVYAGQIKN